MNRSQARRIYDRAYRKLVQAQRELDALSRQMIVAGDGSVQPVELQAQPNITDALAITIRTCARAYHTLPESQRGAVEISKGAS